MAARRVTDTAWASRGAERGQQLVGDRPRGPGLLVQRDQPAEERGDVAHGDLTVVHRDHAHVHRDPSDDRDRAPAKLDAARCGGT